jgi:predicted DCC family thiol-disulfide oxidoreductase YuxK
VNPPTTTSEPTDTQRPVVLFDGECGLCSRGVLFILTHEREPTLRFASLQSAFGQDHILRHGLAQQDTMVYLIDGQAFIRSDAALAISKHLRAPWRWLAVGRWIPRILRDGIYRLIARSRRHWPAATCRIDGRFRGRFIDQ